jgi:hypothetical protein
MLLQRLEVMTEYAHWMEMILSAAAEVMIALMVTVVLTGFLADDDDRLDGGTGTDSGMEVQTLIGALDLIL